MSIKDVAAHLGLSHATVSRALNGKSIISNDTAARVRDAAAALGYVANTAGRLLRGMPGRLIGLIIPDVQNDFYSTVAKVLAERCAAQSLQLILAISEDDSELEARHILAMVEARVAGVVVTPTPGLTFSSAELLRRVPTVQLVRSHPALSTHQVGIDDRAATRLATRHLIDLGHRRIGFIGGTAELSTGVERIGGYHDALREAGMAVDARFERQGAPRPDVGESAVRSLWAQAEPPTALVLGSSQLTLGALLALQAMGMSQPRDVSLVGYGDPPWFRLMTPAVSTVSLPVAELSAAALVTLLTLVEQGHDQPVQPAVQSCMPALVWRGTSGRLSERPRTRRQSWA